MSHGFPNSKQKRESVPHEVYSKALQDNEILSRMYLAEIERNNQLHKRIDQLNAALIKELHGKKAKAEEV